MSKIALLALLACTLGASIARGQDDLVERYREIAERILGEAVKDDQGWRKLSHLTTAVGHRLSGSEQLERAIDWAISQMEKEGFDHVRRLPVKVPHWVRGAESATLLEPQERDLLMLGLGGSVGTQPGGIEADVVVVESFDELEALGRDAVEGKIVAYAVSWQGYGHTVRYRSGGASRAARLGAVGALVRSATGRSLYTPHTGALRYDPSIDKIPAAAITVEDAAWMKRAHDAGMPIRVRLQMEAKTLADADSANVVAEITGSEKPEEIVVMGGHFDSWDVGQGAHDDGAACIAAWQALTLLKRLGLRPKRTLRVVLWTNEENGLAGGRAYHDWAGESVIKHVAAIEMDSGAERPVGFGLGIPGVARDSSSPRLDSAMNIMGQIGTLLEGIDAGEMTVGGGGADIGPLMRSGVPGIALRTIGEHYFDWHHTAADTLDKVEPENLQKATAMLAVVGYILADMPGQL